MLLTNSNLQLALAQIENQTSSAYPPPPPPPGGPLTAQILQQIPRLVL
jgi:hypothetical protein